MSPKVKKIIMGVIAVVMVAAMIIPMVMSVMMYAEG